MEALLCREFGALEGLAVAEVPSPVAGTGQVVITVKAAGVNFPDILMVQGKYQIRPALPFSPGSEFAGVVKEAGEGVTHVKAGDAVVATSIRGGGFAQEALVDAAAVAPVAPGVGFAVAAALMFAHAIRYDREDLKDAVRELTKGRGADVVFDPVGGPMSEPALRATAWNGRFLVIGFASGNIPRIPLNLPLLKGASIVGVFWGEFVLREPERNAANTRELMEAVAAGTIKPLVSARYPLGRAVDALRALERREVIGKIVVEP